MKKEIKESEKENKRVTEERKNEIKVWEKKKMENTEQFMILSTHTCIGWLIGIVSLQDQTNWIKDN